MEESKISFIIKVNDARFIFTKFTKAPALFQGESFLSLEKVLSFVGALSQENVEFIFPLSVKFWDNIRLLFNGLEFDSDGVSIVFVPVWLNKDRGAHKQGLDRLKASSYWKQLKEEEV